MRDTDIIPKDFYQRDTELVAKELLGKILVRKGRELISGIIVETEAYFGLDDPASRAYRGIKQYNRLMWGKPGYTFIYNVHEYWMFNIVAHKLEEVGAVLIRSIDPQTGISIMKRNRPVSKLVDLTNGPGKLTMSLNIKKNLNGIPVYKRNSEIKIINSHIKFEINESHRIGVTKDLNRKLRFFIKGNPSISR
jgi:DNA-3-methyladenine glycosylase